MNVLTLFLLSLSVYAGIKRETDTDGEEKQQQHLKVSKHQFKPQHRPAVKVPREGEDFILPDSRPHGYPLFTARKHITLVLDLDETVYHYSQVSGKDLEDAKRQFPQMTEMIEKRRQILFLRPGMREFLEEVSNDFNIAVFTRSVQSYADDALDFLGLNDLIKENTPQETYRLYRHDSYGEGKDLRKFGIDLKRILLLDDNIKSFEPHITHFKGNRYGTNGFNMVPFRPCSKFFNDGNRRWIPGCDVSERDVHFFKDNLRRVLKFVKYLLNKEDIRASLVRNAIANNMMLPRGSESPEYKVSEVID